MAKKKISVTLDEPVVALADELLAKHEQDMHELFHQGKLGGLAAPIKYSRSSIIQIAITAYAAERGLKADWAVPMAMDLSTGEVVSVSCPMCAAALEFNTADDAWHCSNCKHIEPDHGDHPDRPEV